MPRMKCMNSGKQPESCFTSRCRSTFAALLPLFERSQRPDPPLEREKGHKIVYGSFGDRTPHGRDCACWKIGGALKNPGGRSLGFFRNPGPAGRPRLKEKPPLRSTG